MHRSYAAWQALYDKRENGETLSPEEQAAH